jgi:hypothetical protein
VPLLGCVAMAKGHIHHTKSCGVPQVFTGLSAKVM